MSDPFIGEIRMFGGNFAPRGWAFCNGQILPIAQNTALFSLLGTTYGGNGQTTFALPNLQGRMPMHAGQGPGLSPRALGQSLGEVAHTLTVSELPAHTHELRGAGSASTGTPSAGVALGTGPRVYRSAPANTVGMTTPLSMSGGSQPHQNRSPYLGLSFIIALQGIFPARN